MRVRRANECAGERAGKLDIGDETPAASEKAPVLDAAQRGTDALVVRLARGVHAPLSRMRCSAKLLRSGAPLIRDRHGLERSRVCSASSRCASCRAQVQCGMVKTSCCDHSKVSSPMLERPSPAITRHTTLYVARFLRVVMPLP